MKCPPLRITFLGTGTSGGVPMIGCDCAVCHSTDTKDKRLRSSIMVESATTRLVVDTGPDFRYQMLRQQIKKLDAVVFTHPHKDHMAGLDDIRAFNYFSKRHMDIYADSLTEEALRRDFYYAFSDTRYPGIPELNLNTITEEPFLVGDIPVQPIQVWHHRMPVLGFRFGAFTYITDANRIEPDQQQKITGSEILVLNALRKQDHLSHFTLEQALLLIDQLQIPGGYLTHISHQLGKHAEVEAELPPHIHLAFDGLVLEMP
ncbi:MAG: MBL fold metallo-hydrolase [Bacteroidota bacterium]|jgi:phosphoribosyl 1,2-cyclic phosphate phosphodiesterase|nr:MBL fold metallo-hydrolase [Terrimonas sp.]